MCKARFGLNHSILDISIIESGLYQKQKLKSAEKAKDFGLRELILDTSIYRK